MHFIVDKPKFSKLFLKKCKNDEIFKIQNRKQLYVLNWSFMVGRWWFDFQP